MTTMVPSGIEVTRKKKKRLGKRREEKEKKGETNIIGPSRLLCTGSIWKMENI